MPTQEWLEATRERVARGELPEGYRLTPRAKAAIAAGGVVGAAPVVRNKVVDVVPWQETVLRGRPDPTPHVGPIPNRRDRLERRERVPSYEEQLAAAQADLPPVVHIDHRERFRMLSRMLLEDGLKFYQQFGYVKWPESVEQKLKEIGWKNGQPDLHAQVEALASRFIVEAANQQKEKDSHKVAREHPGHYSA